MNIEKITVEPDVLRKLFALGNGNAALLYLYLHSGNSLQQAARELEFEQAAKLRDEIKKLMGEAVTASSHIKPGMVGSAKKSKGRSRK